MCTRYYMELSPELRPYVEAASRSALREKLSLKMRRPMIREGEVKPGDIAPVIATSQKGTMAAYPMAFGFSSPTGKLVLNARCETANEKPMFREAWKRRRCIVPASWYYEWQHLTLPDGKKQTGDKYLFQPTDSSITWLCGLYRIEEGLPYFVILTRNAPGDLRRIHDRMPLILPGAYISQWIHPDTDPTVLLYAAITNLTCSRV